MRGTDKIAEHQVLTYSLDNDMIEAILRGYPIDELTMNGHYFETLDNLAREWHGQEVSPSYRNPFG